MTPGERLKYIRKERGFTLKALGLYMGYPESSADTRIAQFESSKRGITTKVRERLASILSVSPENFSPHICETPEDLYRSMVWIEHEYGEEAVVDSFEEWLDNDLFEMNGLYDEEEIFERRFK